MFLIYTFCNQPIKKTPVKGAFKISKVPMRCGRELVGNAFLIEAQKGKA